MPIDRRRDDASGVARPFARREQTGYLRVREGCRVAGDAQGRGSARFHPDQGCLFGIEPPHLPPERLQAFPQTGSDERAQHLVQIGRNDPRKVSRIG